MESIFRIMTEDKLPTVLSPHVFSSHGCVPGVYVMWISGRTKIGRTQNIYSRYLSYINGRSDHAERVFLIGFMAALPGEDLSGLEQKLLDTCLELGLERVSGREWFSGTDAGDCLHALSILSGVRQPLNDEDFVLPPTEDLPIVRQAEILFPMYVSTVKRNISYLVMAVEYSTGKTVTEITTIPFRPSWLVLACYVQDPGAKVTPQDMLEPLKGNSKWGKLCAFFNLNAEESDLFFYTE